MLAENGKFLNAGVERLAERVYRLQPLVWERACSRWRPRKAAGMKKGELASPFFVALVWLSRGDAGASVRSSSGRLASTSGPGPVSRRR